MEEDRDRVDVNEVMARVVDRPESLDRPIVVTVGGEDRAILMSPGALAALLREREILRRLALGDLEFCGGEGHPLAEVLEDCDLLLDES